MKKKFLSKKVNKTRKRRLPCFFCENPKQIISYESVSLITRFLTSRGKIIGRIYSGNCARHQKALSRAVKRARQLSLLSYTETHAIT